MGFEDAPPTPPRIPDPRRRCSTRPPLTLAALPAVSRCFQPPPSARRFATARLPNPYGGLPNPRPTVSRTGAPTCPSSSAARQASMRRPGPEATDLTRHCMIVCCLESIRNSHGVEVWTGFEGQSGGPYSHPKHRMVSSKASSWDDSGGCRGAFPNPGEPLGVWAS